MVKIADFFTKVASRAACYCTSLSKRRVSHKRCMSIVLFFVRNFRLEDYLTKRLILWRVWRGCACATWKHVINLSFKYLSFIRRLSFSLGIFLMAAGHSHCFYPNGDLMTSDTPCLPEEEVSPCCGEETTCLANGLCLKTLTGVLFRGTCTDHTWESSNCPQFCTKSLFDIDFSPWPWKG